MKQDPKPHLGRAAIESNISYYSALEAKYSSLYRDSLEQHTYWLRELEKITPKGKEMAYLLVSEHSNNLNLKTASVFKLSGINEWAVKEFDGSAHPLAENRFSSEADAVTYAKNYAGEVEKAKTTKKKTSTGE